MKFNTRALIFILFMYIIAQFLWWEILMVRQLNEITEERKKVLALTISNQEELQKQMNELERRKRNKTYMLAGEGTIFLLLLLVGVNQVRKANKKEQDLFLQKNNFLLSVTHELKTPLATMKLQLQTLEKRQLEPAKQQELLHSAIKENNRLNALIDNILLASGMQHQTFSLSCSPENLVELTEFVMNTHFKTEVEKGFIKLKSEKNEMVIIDKTAFHSVLVNLIDNAIKYSAEEIKVEIEIRRDGNRVLLKIADKGIGISPTDKEKIFDRFYRAGNEETRKTKGTGLGLFIVKYLVEQHNAKITVTDNKPRGTIFQIEWLGI